MSSEGVLARWDEYARSQVDGSRWEAVYTVLICGLILTPALVSMSASLVGSVIALGVGTRAVVVALLLLLPVVHLTGAVLGRIQGPAVRRSVLAWVIAWGPGDRRAVYAPSVARMGTAAGLFGALVGVGAVLALGGVGATGTALGGGIIAMAALIGIVGVGAALLGQLRSPAAAGLLLLSAAPALVYATFGSTIAPASAGRFLLGGLLASVLTIAGSLWWASRRIETAAPDGLIAHSVRWDQARAFAWALDSDGARALYLEPPPSLARIVQAGRPGAANGLWGAMIRRAVLGWRRRPGRLLLGFVLHTAGLGLLVYVLLGRASVGWVLPAVVLAHLGLPAILPGLKQALACVSGVRVFGVPDSIVVAATLLPGILASGVSGAIALGLHGAAVLPHLGSMTAVVGSVVLGSLGFHLAAGLRGAMPASLYVPIPTGLGDPSVLIRLAWPFEGVILMGVIGYAATFLPAGPAIVAGAMVAGFLVMRRWRRRD